MAARRPLKGQWRKTDAERARALGPVEEIFVPKECVASAADIYALPPATDAFAPMQKPKRGEWLTEQVERGQVYNA